MSSTAFCRFELVNVEYDEFKPCTTGVEHRGFKISIAALSRLSILLSPWGRAGRCWECWLIMAVGGKDV